MNKPVELKANNGRVFHEQNLYDLLGMSISQQRLRISWGDWNTVFC